MEEAYNLVLEELKRGKEGKKLMASEAAIAAASPAATLKEHTALQPLSVGRELL